MKRGYFWILAVVLIVAGCSNAEKSSADMADDSERTASAEHPNSDEKALALADSVMAAMGGQQSWDNTKILQWNFFGQRTHTWNKFTGRDSINIPAKNVAIDFNINSKNGRLWKNGREVTTADTVSKYMQQAYQMWVNDAYWLFMPFKMKDAGTTLTYQGMDTTQAGQPAHKVMLSFENVGLTPQNKYYVMIDTSDYMVRQWAYYPEASTAEPRFVLPWNNYKKYGNIMLSGDRGQYTISDLEVRDSWPK